MLLWLFGEYGATYLKGAVAYWRKHEETVVMQSDMLKVGAVDPFRRSSAESAMHYVLTCGYIPGAISASDVGFMPRYAPRRGQVVINPNFQYEIRPHNQAVGQVCNNCGKQKPLTTEYWQRDAKQKDGFKTICKRCRNHQQRIYDRNRRIVA